MTAAEPAYSFLYHYQYYLLMLSSYLKGIRRVITEAVRRLNYSFHQNTIYSLLFPEQTKCFARNNQIDYLPITAPEW